MSEKISILFIGDVVGEPGINSCKEFLPQLKEKYKPDFIIINGENSANGKGLTKTEAEIFFGLGADVLTTGNHVWDNWGGKPLLSSNNNVLRPLNYPPGNVGRGFTFVEKNGKSLAVLQLQGRTFMNSIDCPFRAADNALKTITERTKNIFVDFHADATAEKMAMGWHLDGKVSALCGTHTHIQTADANILPNGTAYITDVGMTGPYDSVVGMDKEIAYKRFRFQVAHKYKMAENDSKICGVNIIIDNETGQAEKIEPFTLPKFIRSIYEQFEV